jgi:hypothetical protein
MFDITLEAPSALRVLPSIFITIPTATVVKECDQKLNPCGKGGMEHETS